MPLGDRPEHVVVHLVAKSEVPVVGRRVADIELPAPLLPSPAREPQVQDGRNQHMRKKLAK